MTRESESESETESLCGTAVQLSMALSSAKYSEVLLLAQVKEENFLSDAVIKSIKWSAGKTSAWTVENAAVMTAAVFEVC